VVGISARVLACARFEALCASVFRGESRVWGGDSLALPAPLDCVLRCVNLTSPTRVPYRTACEDCAREDYVVAASWSCVGQKCDQRPICDEHAVPHKARGHVLSVRVLPKQSRVPDL
jgi:hypothetical protein